MDIADLIEKKTDPSDPLDRDSKRFCVSANEIKVAGYEQVVHFTCKETGLNAIISVHNTKLGPGMGGTRMFAYNSFDDALEDVKRLSKGMTYKNALAGIPFGGGKAVIIGDPKTQKTEDLFRSYGEALNILNGIYWTAEDVGTTPTDMEVIAEVSPFVSGLIYEDKGNCDPSPFTAYGVFYGIKAAVKFKFKKESLKGLKICILGLGNVGYELARLAHQAGAILYVADIDPEKVARAEKEFDATPVPPNEAHSQDVDVFSPCALGGIINLQTVDLITAPIIAGAANNQLASPDMADCLSARNILYAPDYVINGGGVIRVGREIMGEWNVDAARKHVETIATRLTKIFTCAEKTARTTDDIAEDLALDVLAKSDK